jgi:hypothetical protein
VGPAVLATLVILVQSAGYPVTLAAFGVSLVRRGLSGLWGR